MKFRIGNDGPIYSVDAVDKLSLLDTLILQEQSEAMGRRIDAGVIEDLKKQLDELPNNRERGRHPASLWMVAVGIFAARRVAGERISFEEAIDFPLADLQWLPDPQDRKPKKSDPTQGRPASGPAGKRRAGANSTTRTSSSPSTDD